MTSKTRDWWRAHLQHIDSEGLTTKAYASREGLAPASLYYWRKVFKTEAARQPLGQEVVQTKFPAVALTDAQPPNELSHCCLND